MCAERLGITESKPARRPPVRVGAIFGQATGTRGYNNGVWGMKRTDRSQMVGAVLGKALEPLAKGDGVIQVLVSLQ